MPRNLTRLIDRATLTREALMERLASMPPNARGRGEIERLLLSMTCAVLAKPRRRVKAAGRHVPVAGRV